MNHVLVTIHIAFVGLMFGSFCLAPMEALAFQTTQYARVVAQAERIAYIAAQRSSLIGQVAAAAVAPSPVSLAVRVVAGPVGWASIGVAAGIVLAQLYYSAQDLQDIQQAAAPPTGTYSYTFNGQTYTIQPTAASPYPDCPGGLLFFFAQTPVLPPAPGMYSPLFNTLDFCAPTAPTEGGGTPTLQEVLNYLQSLAGTAPDSIEQHTSPVGTTGTVQPADQIVTQPASPAELPTTVKPKPVPPGDITVVDNVPPPPGSAQQTTQQQQTTTTTTTTENPDGSTTEQEDTNVTTSCVAGSHQSRTFGGVLQDHQALWTSSGLLGAVNLLKALTWPTSLPVITLPSAFFGTQSVDFNQWAWFFTVLRTLVIAVASLAAYQIIFVGGRA